MHKTFLCIRDVFQRAASDVMGDALHRVAACTNAAPTIKLLTALAQVGIVYDLMEVLKKHLGFQAMLHGIPRPGSVHCPTGCNTLLLHQAKRSPRLQIWLI